MRLAALCLMAFAVSRVSQAKPVAFKPPVELTDSVNVFFPIWVDADGDGVTDYTGYDYRLNRIVSCVRDPRGVNWPQKRMIIEGGNPDLYSGLFRYDLDGDGRMDLVTAEGRHITWWKSTPGTSLTYQGAWGDQLPPNRVLAGIEDMDKDGHPDLLLYPRVLSGGMGELIPDPALIGYGSSTGSFTWLEVDFETPAQEYPGAEFHDINGDGYRDWIYVDKVALLQGRQLSEVVALPANFNVRFADIDGVPGVELIASHGYEGKSVIFGDSGEGTVRLLKFQAGTWITLADQAFSFESFFVDKPAYYGVHVGNFDADPESEIAIVAREMLITLGYKQGGLDADAIYPFAEQLQDWDIVSVVDREPDGQDSLLIESFQGAKDAGWVMTYDGVPMWKHVEIAKEPFGMSYASSVGISHYPRSLAVVEIDGSPKIASLGKYDRELQVWLSPTGPADRNKIAVGGKQGISLMAGRFRGGDVEELAWLSSDEDSAAGFSAGMKESLIEVRTPSFNGDASSTQYRKRPYSGQMPATLLGKADFNGDGKDDLLFSNPEDGVMSWGSGHDLGALKHEVGYMPLIAKYETLHGAGPENVVVFDVDQDGDPDILQFPSVFGNAVARYTNDGTGRFSVSRLGSDGSDIPVGHAPVAIVAGNFDGSGSEDVAILSVSGMFFDSPSVLRIMTDGNPQASEIVNFEGNIAQIVAADFNGDGLDDIVFGGGHSIDLFGNPMWGTPPCQILARKDSSSFHAPVVIADSLWQASALAAADVNRDGKVDLIHGSSMTGTVTYLEAATVETMPTFSEWAAEMEVSGQDADNDGDGASNFYEYLTGRNPRIPDPNLHSGAVPGEAPFINLDRDERYMDSAVFSLNATHQRPANLPQGTARVVLESSANLRDWVPVDDEPSKVLTEGHPGWETLRWETYDGLPEEENGKFYRFRTWVE